MPIMNTELSDCDEQDNFSFNIVNEKKKCRRISDDSDSENDTEIATTTTASNISEKMALYNELFPESSENDGGSTEINKEIDFRENSENIDVTNTSDSKENSVGAKKTKKKGPQRKSKLSALDEIHSESQRLLRESRVSLPYHRPKQRSLEDFLQRRKSLTVVPLKAAKEKLNEVWQQIENREKMAEKFFDSASDESECEVDNIEKKEKTSEENSGDDVNIIDMEKRVVPNVQQQENNERGNFIGDESGNKVDSTDNCESSFRIDGQCLNNIESYESNKLPVKNIEEAIPTEEVIDSKNNLPKVDSSVDIFADSDTVINANPNSPNNDVSNDENGIVIGNTIKEKLTIIPDINLNITPKIHGSSDGLINLEETTTPSGTVGLIKRFMKHISLKRSKEVKKEEMSILSSEINDKAEIVKLTEETVAINNEDKIAKLGKRLDILKASLKQQMSLTREQLLAKRVQEFKMYEEEIGPEDKLDELEKEEEEDEIDLTETETETEPEDENDVLLNEAKSKKLKNPFVDDEADVTEDEESDNNEEHQEEDGFTADESSCQSQSFKIPKSLDTLLGGGESEVDTLPRTQNEDSFDNLLDLCSGKFSSQFINLNELEANEEKKEISEYQSSAEIIADSFKQLEEESDSEDEEEPIIQKNKIRKKKVYISDDEEDTQDAGIKIVRRSSQDNDEDGNGGETEEEEEVPYDELGDENLIEDEEDELARKIGKGFLDGEAELSGSEWESEDEDEKDLDQLEDELGDGDRISERRLRNELGKIHMKEMMAKDNNEVRILQELLLEDGELHSDGPKRQRIFRWYNDENNKDPDRLVDNEDGMDHYFHGGEDDETWRKSRTEREKYLREKNIDNLEDVKNIVDTSMLNIGKNVVNTKNTPKQNLLKSPDPKLHFKLFNNRGSFLNRSEKILNKLAQISSNAGLGENPIGSSKGKKNMVFAVVSPPKEVKEVRQEEKILKRKADLLISPTVKKLRFSNEFSSAKKISLLEQLRKSDELI